jgi:vacuolar-type H+-ATPase subunit F/Vma7
MSRLLIVTRPALVAGFQLGGVEAYGPEDIESAEELILGWLKAGESGLLIIDDGILSKMDPAFLKRLDSSEQLPYLAIPGGQPLGPESSRRHRIAEMIRRAIGIHITFKEEPVEGEE